MPPLPNEAPSGPLAVEHGLAAAVSLRAAKTPRQLAVDARDVGTPDEWIGRHPDLVRLTGRHPFNCEPPVSALREDGFITSVPLHYVRNHGAVPRLDWSTHRVEVTGLVSGPRSFSMDEIAALPEHSLPVTLVCAGNRRKEENMVKQTIGFNWGSSGVSTNVWTGARLCDLLRACGIDESKARWVWFAGPRAELPKGSDGTYGTQIPIHMAMDPDCDVIVAYRQNGEALHPDHGYPVRVIIPGWIGGRMVKWLTSIHVSAEETQNHYHFFDNRIMPPHVDSEKANAEGWWYKPDYIFNELNINSAFWAPAHGDVVALAGRPAPLRLAGYAYTGGGRRITRVEVSLDDGATWELTRLASHEKGNRKGRHWCWRLWEHEADPLVLLRCHELLVRAWDESNNGQPERVTWNLMGMGNNGYFRVKVHPTRTEAGELALWFEHPTQAGNQPGGWMLRSPDPKSPAASAPQPLPSTAAPPAAPAPAPAAAPAAAPAPAAAGEQRLTMEEVARHNSPADCWIVVAGKVYDCTGFLKDHPGGAKSVTINAGTDTTEEFEAIHSKKAWAMLDDWYVGDVGGPFVPNPRCVGPPSWLPSSSAPAASSASSASSAPTASASAPAGPPVTLDPRKKVAVRLVEKVSLSHDTRRFRFALPSAEHVLGLPVGQHMFLSATVGGKPVMRAYTPTTADEVRGHFDLVVKVYFRGVNPRFPDGGVFSQHLDSLAIGDTVDVKGPTGEITYKGRGLFELEEKPRRARRVGMIAGGTGITPMYQVAKAMLADAGDETEVWLLYANQTEGDILLREELDAMAAGSGGRVRVWYTLDRPPEGRPWPYSTGFVDEAMLRAHMPAPGEETLVFMCGPPPMLKFACVPNLEKIGFPAGSFFAF